MHVQKKEADVAALTATIVAAYVGRTTANRDDVVKLIDEVAAALLRISTPAPPSVAEEPVLEAPASTALGEHRRPVEVPLGPKPAVPIAQSVHPDYLVCLETGGHFKILKPHLNALGITSDAYRQKWGLPADYPMVAPNYTAFRSKVAKDSNLGSQGRMPRRDAPRLRARA